MLRIAKTFLLSLLFVNAFSQRNYQPGFIVSVSGDTTKGLIDYREWKINPEVINFKKNDTDNVISYRPADIQAFGAASDNYVSKIVKIDISPYKLEEITTSREPETIVDTVFLLAYVQGNPFNLYYLMDKNLKEHFFLGNESNTEELIIRRYRKKIERGDPNYGQSYEGQTILVESEVYKGQLTNHFKDCPQLKSKIENVRLALSDLTKLVRKYNECRGFSSTKEKKDRFRVEPGLVSGFYLGKLDFSSSSDMAVTRMKFDNNFSAAGGLFLNIVFPRMRGKFSLYNDLLFTSFKTNAHNVKVESLLTINSDARLNLNLLKLSNIVRYRFDTKTAILPFLQGGVAHNIAFEKDNELITTEFKNSDGHVQFQEKRRLIGQVKKYRVSIIIGAGIAYRKWNLQYRIDLKEDFSDSLSTTTDLTSNYFLLGYRF